MAILWVCLWKSEKLNLIKRFKLFLGVGNTSACAEFNFLVDPEAANIVLSSFQSPITILPWEGCLQDSLFLSKVKMFGLTRFEIIFYKDFCFNP